MHTRKLCLLPKKGMRLAHSILKHWLKPELKLGLQNFHLKAG